MPSSGLRTAENDDDDDEIHLNLLSLYYTPVEREKIILKLNTDLYKGLTNGMSVAVPLLAFLKGAVIMWVYGIQIFSKDIHYWLGFKPTKFWEMTWMILPIVGLGTMTNRFVNITALGRKTPLIIAMSWIGFTVFIVAFINIKTIALFLVNNDLTKAFVASLNYGPPDPEDRKKRRTFDETLQLRRCRHQCLSLDDEIDCNHLPLSALSLVTIENQSSSKDLYSPSEQGHRTSVALNVDNP